MALTACFVSASRQNVFFAELLDALADTLEDHGIAVERSVDCFPPPREQMAYVFVPHELLPLLMPDAHPDPQQLRRSVVICTEQPGTHWFDETAEVAQRAGGVLDINRVGAAALRARGVAASFLQLGYTPRWDRWRGTDDWRRIDATLLAGATPRRLRAVARCAKHLAGRRTELHLPEALVPHRAGSDQFIAGARKWELLSRSRLLINVHRGDLGYFEWQRAVEAICNGCVLLSEHSVGFEPLVPGEHFVSVSFDSLDVALEALLQDEPRLERMRHAAYELLRDEHPLAASAPVLADAIAKAAAAPCTTSSRDGRQAVARPRPPRLPPPAWEREQLGGESAFLRTAITRLLAEQEELRASVRELQLANDAHAGQKRVERLGAAPGDAPRVSVVLSVADEAATVTESIDSVAASDFFDCELVIVDDASSDGSGNRIRAALARAPWLSATLLTSPYRGGVARARNAGVEQAAGELVLVMDARHALYPQALARLVEALEDAPDAAFSYGLVGQEDHAGPAGLTGYLGWEPTMLRYGDFVGGMAMLRRRALLEAGGYATDPVLAGWESLALWCALADRGSAGTRVPEVVARQRLGWAVAAAEASDASAAWSLLLERYACLSATVAA